VPPLATVGITAGLGEWSLALGALLLFATNLVAIVLSASLVLVAAGFAADRDEGSERNARIAKWLVYTGILVVAIPLAFHSWDRYQDSTTRAELVRDAREWATGLTVRDVEMDRSADPAQVTVTVTGTEAPPDASGLAEMVASDLRRAVEVDIVYVAAHHLSTTLLGPSRDGHGREARCPCRRSLAPRHRERTRRHPG